MKRLFVALSTLAVLLVAAPSSAEMTEVKARKLLKKLTVKWDDLGTKGKVLCVCTGGSVSQENRLGWMRHWEQSGPPRAACYLPSFIDGVVVNHGLCNGDYKILSK